MRSFLWLALVPLLACDGGSDTSDDTADDTDTGDDTGDTDTDTSDSDTSDSDTADTGFPDPGADFTANGPGAGYHWFLDPAPTDAPLTNCGVGAQNSFLFYADTWQLQSPSTSLMEFAIALQATPGGTLVCEYAADGTFTCSTITTVTNLNNFPPPYNLDAVISQSTTASGRFRERIDVDPADDQPHTYGARWAADLHLVFSATCVGAHCAAAASGMGAQGFPCTSTFTGLESVNYSDPTLTHPQ